MRSAEFMNAGRGMRNAEFVSSPMWVETKIGTSRIEFRLPRYTSALRLDSLINGENGFTLVDRSPAIELTHFFRIRS